MRRQVVRLGGSTIALYLVSSLGRATPLIRKTVDKSKLKNRRGDWELLVINRLHEILSKGVDIMVVADRGFGDQRLFAYFDTIGWSYAIRFKQNTTVTHYGEGKPASDWVPSSGYAKMLRDVSITQEKTAIGAVVLKHQKGMKES